MDDVVTMGAPPLKNANHERYCQLRAGGKSQREAVIAAYPSRAAWSEPAQKTGAVRLEQRSEVAQRIAYLKQAAAEKAMVSRAEVLSGMAEMFSFCVASKKEGLVPAAVNGVASIGKTLLDALPESAEDTFTVPPTDFGLLLSTPFLPVHRSVAAGLGIDAWLPGGRASGKSTYIALELVYGVVQNQGTSALVCMKNGVDIRDSVWEQILWAIEKLGYNDLFTEKPSQRRIEMPKTGQAIVFRGIDKASKTKSMKAPNSTYFAWQWFEEVDLFTSMDEVRTVMQSATRGAPEGAPFYRFFSFNPPRSRDSWANKETELRESMGKLVIRSTYLDMPREWLPDQLIEDAEELKAIDLAAYEHEWLGMARGYGCEVFDLENRVTFRHVSDEEIAAFERPCVGQDFGWKDPYAITVSEWQANSRTLVTWREEGGPGMTPDVMAEHARAALTWADHAGAEPYYHHLRVLSDDADPISINAMRAEGVQAVSAEKGGMRLGSYRWLASVNWVIDPERCPRLAEEVRNKKHVRLKDGTVTEDIEDGNDHWIDATRYAVMPIVRRSRTSYKHGR